MIGIERGREPFTRNYVTGPSLHSYNSEYISPSENPSTLFTAGYRSFHNRALGLAAGGGAGCGAV